MKYLNLAVNYLAAKIHSKKKTPPFLRLEGEKE